jgi:DNA-binding CsgD family transcriptional regulator
MVSENPIMSSSILACISQWGTFFSPGMSLTKSMRNMVSARNTSTAAIRWSVKLFMIDNLFGGFERKYRKLFFPMLLLCRISCYICMNFMVMERRLFIFCFLAVVVWQSVALAAGTSSFTALTASLDEAIEAHRHYVAVREGRIARLKCQLLDADTANLSFFRWNGEIYKEYKAYICDSAIHYLRVNLDWAERYGQRNGALETRLELAHLMASAGMYEEAAELLRQTDKASLPSHLLPDYYNACHKLYTELSFYTLDDSFKKHYQALATHYDDSLMQVLLPSSPLYLERRETREAAAGHPDEALSINDTRLAHAKPNTPEYALVTYQRSLLYRRLGNREEEKRYLALSALTDIRLSITDHASLWNLAELLYEEGDMEHAYRYIRFSWDETNRYNARSRSLQTAGILSLIDLTYQAMREKQNDRLRLYLWLISALIVLLVVAVGFIYRQMQRLSAARNKLEHANEQLQLSNNIKEEYVGRFMNLCSVYINRLDTYRRMVNKKISAGQMEELLKMVRSREVLDTGLKELYDNFDTAFLHLFPDFVDKFNDLLQPEERIVLRKGELLNTELRIFALIRLGIDDSSQIAEFLRYSVNTIYNYRAKVKNKARISREDFEIRLMQIR